MPRRSPNARPSVLVRCVADNYAAPCERIVEVSDRPTGLGCLISISRVGPDAVHVNIHRRDDGVSVSAARPDGAARLYWARDTRSLGWIVERRPPSGDPELIAQVQAGERAARLMADAMNEHAAGPWRGE